MLEQAQAECLNFNGSGMSVMEMSHRSKAFDGIIKAAEADLRQLLSIPDNYKVLFVQGGASTQFAAIPLNFTQEGGCAAVVATQPCVWLCRPRVKACTDMYMSPVVRVHVLQCH